MYAVFETGGKQYKAGKGDIVFVEKLAVEAGKALSFDALVISDGDNVTIGTPVIEGAKVKAKVLEHGKGRKVIVFKYKPKKDYRKKQGHRQPFTKLEITGITTGKAGNDTEETAAEISAVDVKPAVAKKPAAPKTTAAKPAAAKATTAKAAAEKPAAKKPATTKTTAAKTTAAKKPAAKKTEEKPAE